MLKYRFFVLCASALTTMAIYGLECTAGSLKSLVSNPETLTSLTISGTVDASDLQFIADEMPALLSLDLSEAQIVRLRDSNTIYPEAEIPALTFSGSPLTTIALPEQEGLIIGDAAFAGAAITDLSIPSSVKKIGIGAFSGCKALKSVTLNNKTVLGTDVFNGCEALATADLGGLTDLPDATFSACSSLTEITGTDGLLSIGNRAFADCSALTEFAAPTTLQSIGDEAFTYSALTTADFEKCTSLTDIGERAFAQISTLTTVVLPQSVTTLGSGVFAMDSALTSVTLSAKATSLPDYAFTSSSGVDAADVIFDGVQEIGAYALKGHDKTETMTLPASVSYIGDHAMEGMTALSQIDAGEHTEVPALGSDVWAGVTQEDVELLVGNGMGAAFSAAAQWQDFSIKEASGKIDAVTDTASKVQARFLGYTLQIASIGSEIASASVYNVAGTLLTAVAPNSQSAEIDTRAYADNIYIVAVTLADGTKATAKLLRLN